MIFRLIVLFFTLAAMVLSVWSLVGSHKNESYLTDNYLFGFQLSNVNLSSIILTSNNKRELLDTPSFAFEELLKEPVYQVFDDDSDTPTPTTNFDRRDILESLASAASAAGLATSDILGSLQSQTSGAASLLGSITSGVNTQSLFSQFNAATATGDYMSDLLLLASAASIPDSIVTLAEALDGNVDEIVSELVSSVNITDLGLAEYYSVGYWGYCRGSIKGSEAWLNKLGKFGKQFSNKDVNFTYCSPPKVGFKFDPLEILKHEITNQIKHTVDGVPDLLQNILGETIEAQLLALVSAVTYDDLGLPGDLKKYLNLLHQLTVASFALILAAACLAFISFVFQVIGLCCSPDNFCLSCLSFMLMVLVCIATLVGSGLSTGVYIFVRQQVNNNVRQYGAQGWLSIQYYAFLWSAAAASLFLVVFAFLGYCCGCFHSGKRRYRLVRNEQPQMGYVHKGY
ncbi:CIC11C00000000852 [Sungouiella intermedia]|uniref:CIC11C00000000852 n=1 Tax=Sungouiella intermedia TaxID=45354 RepID=A0A1L0CYH6_9ASCO|nr:CIC11C00000000852 [[Candida] intermedia]